MAFILQQKKKISIYGKTYLPPSPFQLVASYPVLFHFHMMHVLIWLQIALGN